jgi:hypothetical protein
LFAAPVVAIQASPPTASAPNPIGEMPVTAKTLHEVARVTDTSALARAQNDRGYDPVRPNFFEGHAGTLPAGAPQAILRTYGGKGVVYLSTSGGKTLLGYGTIYGSRFIAVVAEDKTVERVVDFFPRALGLGPDEDASSDVHEVLYEDGILYACRGYNAVDRDRKGYVTAIDAATGALRWRSAAQTCGGTLVRFGDYVVTGYGEDVMPYQTRLLRRYDGAVVQSFHNDGASLEFEVNGEKLVVLTYKHRITYDLR